MPRQCIFVVIVLVGVEVRLAGFRVGIAVCGLQWMVRMRSERRFERLCAVDDLCFVGFS